MSDSPVLQHPVSWIADALSAGAIIATIAGYLPFIAAAAGLLWYLIQIWESRTVQHWMRNRQMVRKAKRISKLKAKEKIIVAQLEALEEIRQARVNARDKVETAKVEAAKLLVIDETDVAVHSEDDA